MSEPTTTAGRKLLAELSENPLPGALYALNVVALRVHAIEAEAAAAERERLQTILAFLRAATVQLEMGNREHSAAVGNVFDCRCTQCQLILYPDGRLLGEHLVANGAIQPPTLLATQTKEKE